MPLTGSEPCSSVCLLATVPFGGRQVIASDGTRPAVLVGVVDFRLMFNIITIFIFSV